MITVDPAIVCWVTHRSNSPAKYEFVAVVSGTYDFCEKYVEDNAPPVGRCWDVISQQVLDWRIEDLKSGFYDRK